MVQVADICDVMSGRALIEWKTIKVNAVMYYVYGYRCSDLGKAVFKNGFHMGSHQNELVHEIPILPAWAGC